MHFTVSRVLALIACILFAVAGFGGDIPLIAEIPIGLAFLAAAHVVP